ncbi:imelysin family protein [Zavarzinia compransoris]|uniref:imelysin family protein n=1 Tax=Zavarzinia marina TaxID=2911065 RepID=UPI001F23C6B7|nr:imelysin family protein [Zavarzinia marina]MCF4164139.1 imelysin family protein [Zavarzinia marina]
MRDWLKILTVAGLVFGIPAHGRAEDEDDTPALSAEAQAALAAMNATIIERHVLPRFAALAEAGAALQDAAAAFAAAPDDMGRARLRVAYGALSDAWQGVQHLRFGPSELFMRSSRLMFWPDPRNNVGRQLDALLAAKDTAAFQPEELEKQSVAVQGIPALERLLFGEDSVSLIDADEDAKLRRAAILGIAQVIADQANGASQDWRGGAVDYARLMKATGPDNDFYRTPEEATVELFKALHLAIEVVADRKLTRPLGESADKARPRLLEQWRSGRALDNIRIDLAAAMDLWHAGMADVVRDRDPALAKDVEDGLSAAIATADEIEMPLDEALTDASGRTLVQRLIDQAEATKTLLANRVAPVLGIPLGFNALDGD